jgi:hypothetical protein
MAGSKRHARALRGRERLLAPCVRRRQAADRAVRQQFVHAQESRQRPPGVGDEQGSAPRVSRRITATSMEPRAFWSAGPLFTSATSPQPIIPQRIVSLTPISVVS